MRNLRTQSNSRSGYGILELMIGLALSALISGVLVSMVNTSSGLANDSMRQSDLDARAGNAFERIQTELERSQVDTFTPALDEAGTTFADDLQFLQVTTTDENGAVFGQAARIWLEYDDGETDDGTDEDGDGLIDECQLRMTLGIGTSNTRTLTLVHDVAEYGVGELANGLDDDGDGLVDERGFFISRRGDLVLTSIVLQGPNSIGTVDRRARTSSLFLRNR